MFSLTPNRILSHWPFADQILTPVYHEVCRSVHFHASHVLVKFPLTMTFKCYFLLFSPSGTACCCFGSSVGLYLASSKFYARRGWELLDTDAV